MGPGARGIEDIMADIAGTSVKPGSGCCESGCGSDCQDTCQDSTCAAENCPTCGAQPEALQRIRAEWLEEIQAEIERLQRRISELEAQNKMHASRRICALMTELDSLDRHVLHRDVTSAQLKKAGMEKLGLDRGK